MSRGALTGSRIRERRNMLGMRQADLARNVGISASYLNLIEHNRRRIGGKLLMDIAHTLDVEPAALSEGAEAHLVARLREAAADGGKRTEIDRVDEFAGRFPGWAELVVDKQRRVTALERTVEVLTDRLTHDPFLSAALHDILTAVTSIRSTSSILVETPELEPEWRSRFHRNINEDSQRLSEASRSLVTYLDGVDDIDASSTSPQEELEAFLGAFDFHFPELEEPVEEGTIENLVSGADLLRSGSARTLAAAHLYQYAEDARRVPLAKLRGVLGTHGLEPAMLAGALAVDLPTIFRRLAALPREMGYGPIGLVACDASGTLVFRKQIEGFPLPRFGAACPLWPLFRSLSQPMMPLLMDLAQSGRGAGHFRTYSIAQPVGDLSFGKTMRFEASMLVIPEEDALEKSYDVVGVSCRICPRSDCGARREPSILAEGF
ncbi:DUF2083 domain-containing protein [Donghicola sp. C2-DW-16]|uniref:DUF2083 domain-containing protein n=1 Tax=Donghicola mangrovi TaxID=2729614 RepID=A0A850QB89_9RHOB|nr:helix-turn-helix transcriptional regulator [Donghicola mangrovi]NVO23181.1 DUF2083 domain-containing protein [Donghicola mangrovi]NVO28561.1 DUF2083 domain-containing protein [Donghicola mangrovi]